MWQGGLAAGKPSVPWYQIHVRGIPGWRACRRPQARPPRLYREITAKDRLVLLAPAAANSGPARGIVLSTHAPTLPADTTEERRRRRHAVLPKIGIGTPDGECPRRHDRMLAPCDLGKKQNSRRQRSSSAAQRAAQTFGTCAACTLNRTLTLPEHEEGAKEAFEGSGFRRRAHSGVVPWTERTPRF